MKSKQWMPHEMVGIMLGFWVCHHADLDYRQLYLDLYTTCEMILAKKV